MKASDHNPCAILSKNSWTYAVVESKLGVDICDKYTIYSL